MYVRVLGLAAVIAVSWLLVAMVSARAERPAIGKPPPEGVVELVGVGGISHSLVELQDGSLMVIGGSSYRLSTDGGLTWGESQSLGEGISGNGILRLQSGVLALTSGPRIWLSEDEGKTWRPGTDTFPQMLSGPYNFYDEMIQLKSGRLVYPYYASYSGRHPELLYEESSAYGTWRGQRMQIEGHGHLPEIYVTLISYSDDEGQNWTLSEGDWGKPNALMGWFDAEGLPTGYRGVTGCGEATVAETSDGRVLLFARPTVNRIVYSYSTDGGESWSAVLPTQLANSISPPRLRRIPQTGDLMCVWNQVSAEEIRRGYRRGRLSVAISKDSGATWQNFKTIEVSEGLRDIARIPPEYPVKLVRARDDVGQLPDGWAYFHYANVCFAGDKVYIMYSRGSALLGIAEQNLKKQEQVTRIYPLEWFYQ